MDGIKFESVIDTNETISTSELDEFYPQSVVFIFGGYIKPIACDIKYLYAVTRQKQAYDVVIGSDVVGIRPTNGLQNISNRNYKFLDTIKQLSFRYGLVHEYYKNKFGVWVDLNKVRPSFAVKNSNNNPFQSLNTSLETIDDALMETSIYTKICDSKYFSDPDWKIYRVDDINDIPQVDRYIVKEHDSNDGIVYRVGRGDGTYELPQSRHIIFEDANHFNKDNVHKDDAEYGKFTYRFADHISGKIGIGSYLNNDHHKYDDLELTFTKADGVTPYTDLDDLFITCNGLVVDYEKSDTYNNKIYLTNVVKFASYQDTSIKEAYNPNDFTKIKSDISGDKIVEIDVPEEARGKSCMFDIKIHKWENVSVSHFYSPLSKINLLKVEPTEPDKSFWLTVGLNFSEEIDKSKSILLCGNEIVPKSDWYVDKHEKNVVRLPMVSAEFDIVYSEVYNKLQEYLVQIIKHNKKIAPKIEDYLNHDYTNEAKKDELCYVKVDTSKTEFDELTKYYYRDDKGNFMPSIDTNFLPNRTYYVFQFDKLYGNIDQAIKHYNNDIAEFLKHSGEYNIHFEDSALHIVSKQFMSRNYALIKFDSIDSKNYEIEVIENRKDLDFNRPYRNRFRNKHWEPDDILILNGMNYHMVNLYEDVFTMPQLWYLTDIEGIFDYVDGYKLQVVKHKHIDSKYMKLNKAMIVYGPIEGVKYYTRSPIGIYEEELNLDKFYETYVTVSDYELKQGMNPHEMYFTYNDGEYRLVPPTITEFKPDVTYYTCKFNNDYYIKK